MELTKDKVTKRKRRYYPEDLNVANWESVGACLEKLEAYKIKDTDDLIRFMEQFSELQMLISEEQGRRYTRMTCNTDNEEYSQSFNDYYNKVVTKAKPYNNKMDLKFSDSPHKKYLNTDKYQHLQNIIANRISVYCQENVELGAKEQQLSNEYSKIIAQMTVQYEGRELTIAQLNKYLQHPDREVREKVWNLRLERLGQDREKLDVLFDELMAIRQQQAKNAGFANYRDYKHKEMGRFSYSSEDVHEFHRSVEKAVLPFLEEVTARRQKDLGIDAVRPFDTAVETDGKTLKPFVNIDELIDKAIAILYQVDPKYGINLKKMKNTGLLDLENRKGKSPGGYNYPLRELGSSFIMMNAVGVHRDVVTLLHEAGHAMHSFATRDMHLMDYKECPHESAELASMAMEMLTMEYWGEYYPNNDDYRKARKQQLIKTLQFLPWCMTIDAFQQWIYTNPNHTAKQRSDYFSNLVDRFNTGVDWSGLEGKKEYSWMLQLHIFKYPFYYIEYGIAQLAALAIYRNYTEKGNKAIEDYDLFMQQGYSKPCDKLYETGGIKFDFSEGYIKQLVQFVAETESKI